MSIKKYGFAGSFGVADFVPLKDVASQEEIVNTFKEVVAKVQEEQEKRGGTKISPLMKDFLYAHCIMMHSAEASLIDQNTGEFLKNARGEPVRGGFEKTEDPKGKPTVKWVSADGILPYRNQNRDIFPEEDLILAHKAWVGKPLCKDHISSSVDGIRGIIIDTFYDAKFKRVHALFALDRKNYADLSRKVEAGYATNVSMGTAVGRSICTECGTVATTENEYCPHVRAHANYGEINKDLTPIELSLVVTGADPAAKVRTIIAQLNNYFSKRATALGETPSSVEDLHNSHADLEPETVIERLEGMKKGDINAPYYAKVLTSNNILLKSLDSDLLNRLLRQINKHGLDGYQAVSDLLAEKDGFAVDTVDTELPDSLEESVPQGKPISSEVPMALSSASIQNKVVKNVIADKNTNDRTGSMNEPVMIQNKEIPMSFEDIKKRAKLRRKAYSQGTEEVQKYPLMGDADKIRATQDKQMVGDELDTTSDIPKEDLKKKELLQRAEIEGRRERRAAVVARIKSASDVMKKKDETGKEVLVKKNDDGTMETLEAKDGAVATETKKAYWQGTEAPTKYPMMGDSDKIRAKDDKQMSGRGSESGADGMHPGYGESDESVKRRLQRMASLTAKLFNKNASPGQAFWEVYADGRKVLTVSAAAAYDTDLNRVIKGSGSLAKTARDLTGAEFFRTASYAGEVMKLIRSAGLEKAAAELAAEMPAAPDAPAAPAPGGAPAPAAVEGQDKEKVEDALSGIEDACDAIRSAVGVEELKEVDVAAEPPMDSAVPALPAPTASREDLLAVYATMTDVAEQIAVMSDAVDVGHSEVQPLLTEAIADAEKLASHSTNLLVAFAAKKKEKAEKDMKPGKGMKDAKDMKALRDMKDGKDAKKDPKAKDAKDAKEDKKPLKKKKSDSELLAELLQVRAERRAGLVRVATEGMGDMDGLDDTTDLGLDGDTTEVDGAPVDGDADGVPTPEEIDAMLAAFDEEHGTAEADDTMYASDMDVGEDDAMCAKDEDHFSKEEKAGAEKVAKEEVEKHNEDEGAHEGALEEKKAARRAWRDALVAQAKGNTVEGLPLSADLMKAHPGGGFTTEMDISATGDLARVETLSERHDAMMDIARSAPRNVRMAAEKLNKLFLKGAMNASQLDTLVAEGQVDAETAAYWKQYWGQVDGGKEFSAGLTKDFKSAKASLAVSDDVEQRDAKLARAYAIALDAQDKEMIGTGRTALHTYASKLAKMPDDVFEGVKGVIAQHKKPGSKVATAAPRSGLNYDTGNSMSANSMEVASSNSPSFEDLASLFGKK